MMPGANNIASVDPIIAPATNSKNNEKVVILPTTNTIVFIITVAINDARTHPDTTNNVIAAPIKVITIAKTKPIKKYADKFHGKVMNV